MQSFRDYLRLYGIYAVLAIPLLVLLHADLRPLPVYPSMSPAPGEAVDGDFAAGKPIVVELDAPGRNVTAVYVREALNHAFHQMRVRITNLESGQTAESIHTKDGDRRFPGFRNERKQPIRMEFQWIKDEGPAPVKELRLSGGATLNWITVPVPDGPRAFVSGKEWTTVIRAPVAELSRIDLAAVLADPKSRVSVEIENLDQPGKKDRVVLYGGTVEKKFRLGNAAGDRLQFTFAWKALRPPALRAARDAPLIPVKYSVEGNETSFHPFFCLEYAWPTRVLLWLWLPTAVLGVCALRRQHLIPYALVAIGLCAVVTSCLSWQQLSTSYEAHHDPDHFGANGERLAAWVTHPPMRAEMADSYIHWRYAWLPLVPSLIAIQRIAGIPMELAYLFICALPSFGAALVFHAILRRGFQLEPVFAFIGTTMAICHHVALKSFSMPSNDPLGYLFLVAGLFLVMERLRHESTLREDFYLGGIVLLSLLTRPTGLLISPALVGMAILADLWRKQRIELIPAFWTGLRAGVLPVAVVGTLFILFGWGKALTPEAYSRDAATPERFLKMTLTVVQWLPLLWIAAWARRKEPALWVIGMWVLTYFSILVLVRPGYVPRLFMPFAFAMIIPAVLGLKSLWVGRATFWRWAGVAAVSLFLIVNVGIVIYHSSVMFRPPAWIAEYIYH